MLSALNGQDAMCRVLIEAGAEVNAMDSVRKGERVVLSCIQFFIHVCTAFQETACPLHHARSIFRRRSIILSCSPPRVATERHARY